MFQIKGFDALIILKIKMDFIQVQNNNISEEHICCGFSDKKCEAGYQLKKQWLTKEFDRGYKFRKGNVRHKVFIEYGPAENAWYPVIAPGYTMLGCFWVAGQYKGKGHGKELLQQCLKEAEHTNGVIALSSKKKTPFLSDPKFLKMNGFEVVDAAPPHYELLVKKNDKNAPDPKFMEHVKNNRLENKKGLTVFYTNQCVFTDYYVNVEYRKIAEKFNLPLEIIYIKTKEELKKLPSAFPIHNIYLNGEFLTTDIQTVSRFEKLMSKRKM